MRNLLDLIPGSGPVRWIIGGVGAILAVVIILTVASKFGITFDPFGWQAAKHEADRVGNIAGQAGKRADDAATKAGAEFDARKDARRGIDEENADAIGKTENAGADAGDAGLAGFERVCATRPDYADDPRCVQLRRARPPSDQGSR